MAEVVSSKAANAAKVPVSELPIYNRHLKTERSICHPSLPIFFALTTFHGSTYLSAQPFFRWSNGKGLFVPAGSLPFRSGI
jgi:hypothetical protein